MCYPDLKKNVTDFAHFNPTERKPNDTLRNIVINKVF